LARLSVEQRRALDLRIVQERSYAEVASDLGISELAARARVSRGLRALGRALDMQLAPGESS
jgi:RNA polymerase sigma-70 factor (ECF subfamily)